MGVPTDDPETDIENKKITEGEIVFKPFIGLRVDILDSVQRWSEAEILKVDVQNQKIYITYLYWEDKWNEWISFDDDRIAPIHTHTYHEKGTLKVGQRIECKDTVGKWIEAYVIEEDEYQVKVHYKGFAAKYDEWIGRSDSSRIRPYGLTKPVATRKGTSRTWSVPGSGDKDSEKRTRQITELSNRYEHYMSTLRSNGLVVVPVAGDGNCLFRAISHQVYGDDSFHHVVRAKCMDYMEVDSAFFSQFVEGGLEAFGRYLEAKRCNACWGDDPEIQAICELYDRPAEIWAYDPTLGAKKLRTFHEAAGSSHLPPIRVSYYGGGHYDSIVPIVGCSQYAPLSYLTTVPGAAEDRSIQRLRHRLEVHSSGDARFRITSSTSAIESEEAAVELAVQRSRQDLAEWGDQDLQQTLMVSALEADEQDAYLQLVAADMEAQAPGSAATGELVAVQGEILRTVAEQSEREFIERAIQDSLLEPGSDLGVTDEEWLQQATLESLADQQRLASDMESEELARALELSVRLDRCSSESQGGIAPAFAATDDGLLTEDSMLQAALQESLTAAPPSALYDPSEYDITFLQESDEDLELRRAIEESLRLAS